MVELVKPIPQENIRQRTVAVMGAASASQNWEQINERDYRLSRTLPKVQDPPKG